MAEKLEPWKSDNWWVSPWDFEEEVVKDFTFSKQVRIHDITLRDGEQQAGVMFSKDDKIRIAEKLAGLGVQRIEPAMPIVSAEDEAAVREIVKRNLGSEIFAGTRSIVDEIKLAADCGVAGVTIGTPVSEHLIQYGLGWPLERALDAAIQATQAAKELGLYTAVFPIDGSRASMDWYFKFVEQVAKDGHMDSLVVSDTLGVLSPHGVSCFIKKLKKRVNVPLELHFHNHFGMAVANTVAGVTCGADVIHTAITGIGEGSGNCCLEEAAMALLALYGVDIGIKYDQLYEISKLVGEVSGTSANRPIVGENVYDIETGEVVLFYRNVWKEQPTVYMPLIPRFVGHPDPKVVMGKKSGIDSVQIWADRLGIKITKEQGKDILTHVKRLATDIKRLITEDEFKEICRKVVKNEQ